MRLARVGPDAHRAEPLDWNRQAGRRNPLGWAAQPREIRPVLPATSDPVWVGFYPTDVEQSRPYAGMERTELERYRLNTRHQIVAKDGGGSMKHRALVLLAAMVLAVGLLPMQPRVVNAAYTSLCSGCAQGVKHTFIHRSTAQYDGVISFTNLCLTPWYWGETVYDVNYNNDGFRAWTSDH